MTPWNIQIDNIPDDLLNSSASRMDCTQNDLGPLRRRFLFDGKMDGLRMDGKRWGGTKAESN